MSNISQKLINAMGVIAEDAVKKAGYDKTIQVQILSCQDQAQGKYRCRYQDAIFYAYSNNPQVNYSNGSHVYVLVPGNDMSKKKNIVGSTQDLGLNYATNFEAEDFLEKIGINCVTSNDVYYLDSNNINYNYDIYKSNKITLDNQSLNTYIKESSYLILSATITTDLDIERQYSGHYGITFKLLFKDNASNNNVIRTFTIDQDNMIGNPYKLQNIRQYQTFPIDGTNFVGIQGIEIFNSDFSNANGTVKTGQLNTGDIILSNIEVQAANKLSEDDLNGVIITLFTPDGTFFNNYSLEGSSKQITAQIRVKGKILNDSKKIPFFWGIENVGITPSSPFYNKHLGRGWKCLNKFNTIIQQEKQQNIITKQKVIQWVPASDTYYLPLEEAIARNNRIRVAAIYEGNVIYKEINIQNLSNNAYEITIESSGGEKFYLDYGSPTLTCKINGREQPNNYTYKWALISNKGIFTSLLQGNNYSYIQKIQKNKIYNLQVRSITNFAIFKCSVYNGQRYVGTGSIILRNMLQSPTRQYTLIIENGSTVFKYDESGMAPTSQSLLNPIQIKALNFKLYDNYGQVVPQDKIVASGAEIKWQVPNTNTMIIVPTLNNEGQIPDEHQSNSETVFYSNIYSLIYKINPKYNISKKNNQIKLHLKYKGVAYVTSTQFLFVKEGQDGSNGTEYFLKIQPNTNDSNPPDFPIITFTPNMSNRANLNYTIGTSTNNILYKEENTDRSIFKVKLWHNDELVVSWVSSNTHVYYNDYPDDGVTSVTWQLLSNKYGTDKEDDTVIEVASNGAIKLKDNFFTVMNSNTPTPIANIVKCTMIYEGKTYYATIPIIITWLSNSSSYSFKLKEETGFRYVIYSSEGAFPKYNNTFPFQFELKDGTNNTLNSNYTYEIQTYGSTKTKENNSWVNKNSKQLTILTRKEGLKKNQFELRPAAQYNGQCVTNGVFCICKKNNSIVGKIYVPIHFYLNRFAFSHLNNWDGNSIQINNQGGFILSPQMGAGKKDSNNAFTGLLMGQVKEPSKNVSNIGLLGYNKGERTVFINSENGSALFGKPGNGQIIIDPNVNRAYLYSSNYWKNYNSNTGLPTNYSNSNINTDEDDGGLLIDLSTPEIKYGNGNFKVNSKGYLTANKGNIGNWYLYGDYLTSQKNEDAVENSTINARKIVLLAKRASKIIEDPEKLWTGEGLEYGQSPNYNNKITIPAGAAIYSGSHDSLAPCPFPIQSYTSSTDNKIHYRTSGAWNSEISDSEYEGFYLGHDGFSIGAKFKVTKTGTLYIGTGAVKYGGIQSSYGVTDNKYWVLNANSEKNTYLRCGQMRLYPNYLSFNDTTFQQNGVFFSDKSHYNKNGVMLYAPDGGYIGLTQNGLSVYNDRGSSEEQINTNHRDNGYFSIDFKTGKVHFQTIYNSQWIFWEIIPSFLNNRGRYIFRTGNYNLAGNINYSWTSVLED